MSIIRKIKKLKTFKKGFPVLSIYLGFNEKKTPTVKQLLSKFHSLTYSLTKEDRKIFAHHIELISKYLTEEYDSRGNRSVVFFCAEDLFEIFEFEFYLEPVCVISDSPHLEPIIEQTKIHNKYLVLLADREKMLIFTVHLGRVEEHYDFFNGGVPQKVRADEEHYYGRSNKIFRHIEDHLNRQLKIFSEKALEFAKNKEISFIIIGGHKELFEKIKKHLPKELGKKVLGEFVSELNIPLNDIFLQSKRIAEIIRSLASQ